MRKLLIIIILAGTVYGQDSYNTTLIGQWANGPCHTVNVSGSYAYVADASAGIHIIDVSTPSSPQEVGFYDGPGPGHYTSSVAISGNYAYVAEEHSNLWDPWTSLHVFDVSDPSLLQEVGNFYLNDLNRDFPSVAINGSYAYVTDGRAGLSIIDISSPSSPQEVGFFDIGYGAKGIAVSGSYAYVAGGGAGLRIINISSPSSPQEVGFSVPAGVSLSVTISGSYAYLGDLTYDTEPTYSGVHIIDVSTPSSPQEVGSFGMFPAPALSIAVRGNYAYVAAGPYGLRIIDVSTPSSPQEVGFFDTGGYVRRVTVSGGYVYVADGDSGLYIIQNNMIVDTHEESPIPELFELHPNYPNPFNPTTSISYELPEQSLVKLTIFNIQGQQITSIQDEQKPAGTYEVQWNGVDQSGNPVSTGVYFAQLQAGEYSQTIKMIYLR
jgi:hypothetical protein